MDILLVILIGLIAGALAGRVVSGHGYGVLGDIVVGVVGALLGGWVLLRVFGIVAGGLIGSLVTAFIGAVILLWLIRLVAPSRAQGQLSGASHLARGARPPPPHSGLLDVRARGGADAIPRRRSSAAWLAATPRSSSAWRLKLHTE